MVRRAGPDGPTGSSGTMPRGGRTLTLRARLSMLALLFGVMLFSTTAAALVAASRARAERLDIDARIQPGLVDARVLMAAYVDQETGLRGYVITGQDSFLEPYDAGRVEAPRRVEALRTRFARDERVRGLIEDVTEAAERWRVTAATPEIAARRSGDAAEATRIVAAGAGKRAFDRLRAVQDDLVDGIEGRISAAEARADDADRVLRVVLIVNSVLLVGLAVLVALLVRRWVLGPVERLRTSMRRVGAGALGKPVLASGPPEVMAIGADAEAMRRRLVLEVSNARSALEGLEQHSPVVAGMRAELSAEPLEGFAGLAVSGVLRPMEGVLAGDWWQSIVRPAGTVALVVADVSGHGAGAGLVALRFKQRLTTVLQTDLDLLSAFRIATRELERDPERFVTCLVAEIDPEEGALRWVNAGHPAGMLARPGPHGPDVVLLEQTGPILSVLGGEYDVDAVRIEVDDLLLVLTDGILEARSLTGRQFGEQGVIDVLRSLDGWTPETVVNAVEDAVRDFAGAERQDDVTAVAALVTADRAEG